MREEERRARDVLQAVFGGEVESIDPGGGASPTPDLLLRKDAKRIAIEVTSLTSEEHRHFLAARNKHGHEWPAGELNHSWRISLNANVNLRHISDPKRDEINAQLKKLQSAGVRVFSLPDGEGKTFFEPHNVDRTTCEVLSGLGVRAGLTWESSDGSIVLCVPYLPGDVFDVSDLSCTVCCELTKNSRKLLDYEADERFLFLWVYYDSGAPSAALSQMAMEGDKLRLSPPSFPDGIKGAWVAPASAGKGELTSALFYVDRSGWKYKGPVRASRSADGSRQYDILTITSVS